MFLIILGDLYCKIDELINILNRTKIEVGLIIQSGIKKLVYSNKPN